LAALAAISLQASIYTLIETTMNGGGGPTQSIHYATESSLGGVFYVEVPPASPSFTANGGYIGGFNEAPVLLPDEITVPGGQSGIIPISQLLANDYDLEGQDFSLLGVSSFSANGLPVVIQNGNIVYNPARQITGPDSFTYTVSDEFGNISEGTVFLKGPGAGPFLRVTALNGAVRLSFFASQGRAYELQAAESLSSRNWHTVVSSIQGNGQVFNFVDTRATSFRARFYRSVEL
jgi:hypothetical protein